ncbi:hypothetical protein GUITHDRAFT_103518 [Guillardia theta CCMP2712]|uniref:Uncharacterized protein n=1 Tax=Guillardia theta (strain CCMP2712) TaxID=905079 RepID=L1JR68_GUITC|nr:hypothetical protein GUITHDRAFT_103518 [Guillardia theta CCMP2712]EKX50937.1 hypothetical protein GUITHDRAFT_103518 [Guillardia theta CCMP2712]|eukprot:XP_005837917.1 hypothetical protein GUITHDRAFT_103518 [Guillardia theta CCMP2712]
MVVEAITSMGDIKKRLSQGIEEALRALTKNAPIDSITRRNIKEYMAKKKQVSEDDIQGNSEYFKDEVQRLFLQVQEEIESRSKVKEKRQNPDHHGSEEKGNAETAKKRVKPSKRKLESESESDSEDERPKASKKSREGKTKSNKADKEPVKTELSKECQRLKELAKKCDLVVPVNCFKGEPDSDELARRIGKYLLERGLPSLNPSRVEIAELKRKVALSRELDGIETSNIVVSSRRHRGDDDEEEEEKPRRLIVDNSDSDD